MSSSSASSSRSLASSSSASSLSSASSAWSPAALHMSTMNTPTMRTPPAHKPAPAVPTIASLPSLAHSLSSFPTMTVVTNDMVHYGSTKGAEAKLNSALRKTKQRKDLVSGAMMSAPTASARARYPTPDDDEPVLLIVPKRSKGKQSS